MSHNSCQILDACFPQTEMATQERKFLEEKVKMAKEMEDRTEELRQEAHIQVQNGLDADTRKVVAPPLPATSTSLQLFCRPSAGPSLRLSVDPLIHSSVRPFLRFVESRITGLVGLGGSLAGHRR